jgi:hypothetical protein
MEIIKMPQTKPIIFNAEMVRAILDGRKKQTRRVVSRQPIYQNTTPIYGNYGMEWGGESLDAIPYPYGNIGDYLWVRETWAELTSTGFSGIHGGEMDCDYIVYRADYSDPKLIKKIKWKPSIHMPREASRITLEITGIRVERLQDISEQDAIAEGVTEALSEDLQSGCSFCSRNYYEYKLYHAKWAFKFLWNSIYSNKHPWESNPWVWVIEFKVV